MNPKRLFLALFVCLTLSLVVPATASADDAWLGQALDTVTVNIPDSGVALRLVAGRGLYTNGLDRASVELVKAPLLERQTPQGADVIVAADVGFGGTGRFTYLMLFRVQGGNLVHSDSIFLADQGRVQRLTSRESSSGTADYEVVVEYMERAPGQAQAEAPSQRSTKTLQVKGHEFLPGQSPR